MDTANKQFNDDKTPVGIEVKQGCQCANCVRVNSTWVVGAVLEGYSFGLRINTDLLREHNDEIKFFNRLWKHFVRVFSK